MNVTGIKESQGEKVRENSKWLKQEWMSLLEAAVT